MEELQSKPASMTNIKEVPLPPLRHAPRTEFETDVLIVGGGYAGIFAALRADEKGQKVLLVDKGIVGKSGQSPWAGGLNFFDASFGDDYDGWLLGMQKRSEYVGNMDYAKMWLENSRPFYNQMLSMGLIDPLKSSSPEAFWDPDKESAREFLAARIKQDRHEIMRKRLKDRGIPLVERVMLTDLLMQEGRVVGAIGFWMESEEVLVFRSRATILCTGAGSYGPVGYPTMGCTFDGDAMAYRAGAAIAGKEYVASHLTSQKSPGAIYKSWGSCYLNSIALMGGSPGKILIEDPANTIHNIINDGFADTPMKLPSFPPPSRPEDPRRGAPPVAFKYHEQALDGAAVGMAPHKAEGIFPVDARCFSGVPGLYAAGDALASVSGARYASFGMSFSASAIQGKCAAEAASDYAAQVDLPQPSAKEIALLTERLTTPRKREKGFDPRWLKDVLLTTMAPAYILLIKNRARLEGALENVQFMQEFLVSKLRASNPHELRLCHEVANLVLNAEMKLRASLMRTESRGSHYRQDYPARNDKEWLAWILVRQDSHGKMTLTKKPVPETWVGDLDMPYQERYPIRFPGEMEFLGLVNSNSVP
jgi:succinate dehydrogenase/fumarate reductase flavoprotein subunit